MSWAPGIPMELTASRKLEIARIDKQFDLALSKICARRAQHLAMGRYLTVVCKETETAVNALVKWRRDQLAKTN